MSESEPIAQLRSALQELYDATGPIEAAIGVASEDWHHDFFTATGIAFGALMDTGGFVRPSKRNEVTLPDMLKRVQEVTDANRVLRGYLHQLGWGDVADVISDTQWPGTSHLHKALLYDDGKLLDLTKLQAYKDKADER